MLMGPVLGNNTTSADVNMSPGCWAMYCFVQSAGHFFYWLPCLWEEGEAYQVTKGLTNMMEHTSMNLLSFYRLGSPADREFLHEIGLLDTSSC